MQAKVILITWEQLENPKNKKSIKDQRLWDDLVPISRGNFSLKEFDPNKTIIRVVATHRTLAAERVIPFRYWIKL